MMLPVLIFPLIDGVHFTLHAKSDREDLFGFQELQINILKSYGKSFRLYVESGFPFPVTILPDLWSRVEMKPWKTEGECPLPLGETLFIYQE